MNLKKVFRRVSLILIFISPLLSENNRDIEKLENSMDRLDRKVDRLEKTINEMQKSNDQSDSNFYADTNQTKMPVNPDYYNGPYTVRNNFHVISFVSMSNKKGERAAFVTLKNEGAKTRISKAYIIATFADNTRAIATDISSEDSVGEGGFVSLTAYFGKQDSPVVDVSTR